MHDTRSIAVPFVIKVRDCVRSDIPRRTDTSIARSGEVVAAVLPSVPLVRKSDTGSSPPPFATFPRVRELSSHLAAAVSRSGPGALAYLHAAACEGCEWRGCGRTADGGGRETKRMGAERRCTNGERSTSSVVKRRTIRNANNRWGGSAGGRRWWRRRRRREKGGGDQKTHSAGPRPAACNACYLYVACLPTRVTIRIPFA